MPNPLEILRMMSIFNPQSMEMANQPGMQDPMAGMNLNTPARPPALPNIPVQSGLPTQGSDVGARMRELYQPETAASDRFNELQNNYPQYEKPGFWRSAAGALSAFGPGGHEIGMKVANQHNDQRMSDWKNQIGPAQQAANIERQENVNSRTLAHNTVQNEISGRRLDETTRNNERNSAVRESRARVYEWKSRNPGMKFNFSGPKVLMTDPTTGKVTNTGIDTGNLSDEDKMDIGQDNAMQRIGAQGAVQSGLETQRQTGRETVQDQRAWSQGNVPDPNDPTKSIAILYNSITGETKPLTMGGQNTGPVSGTGGGAARPELPTQGRVREFTAARELFNTNPELRPFIKLNPQNNTFEIAEPKPPTSFGGYTISKGGPTTEQFEAIKNAIYGGGSPGAKPPLPTGTPGGGRGGGSGRGVQTPRFTPQNPPPAPAGFKYVPKPGGGWTAVPIGG